MLSESVAKALPLVVGDEAAETAEFVSKFDSFFDILNVSNFTNGTRNRKPFQHPYRHASDPRLKVCTYTQCLNMHKSLIPVNYSGSRRHFCPTLMTGKQV